MLYARPRPATQAFAIRLLLVICGSLVMAIAAKISLPMFPVPITGQTFAIPLLVALLGRNAATLSILTYLAEGACGLPVFASGALLSATGGYLLAFPVAAFTIGLLFERGLDRTYLTRFVAIFAGTALVFAGGVAWLVAIFHLSAPNAIAAGVLPFMIGDALKCALAAGITPVWPRIEARLGLRTRR
jgi:biotin transport system substrate-specific component